MLGAEHVRRPTHILRSRCPTIFTVFSQCTENYVSECKEDYVSECKENYVSECKEDYVSECKEDNVSHELTAKKTK